MRDLKYYVDNFGRYQRALPKLRRMVEDIEQKLHDIRIIGRLLVGNPEELDVIKHLENKRAAILIQIGRIQGIISVVEAPIEEPEINNYIFKCFIASERNETRR